MPADAPSPLQALSALGQSVWVDFLSRSSINGGHLQELIDDYSVVGATSNPSIFEKAMGEGDAYDEQIQELARQGTSVDDTFWVLAQQDIAAACALFRGVWDAGQGRDGYVSLEVDPRLAYDTLATFREAMRLHTEIDLPNLMVKIPATKPGLASIEDVIAKGRSINVTLIFSLARYAEVAESYVRGIERLVAEGGDPRKVASVASFFVSRIDTAVDKRLEGKGHDDLLGTAAIANARHAYRSFERMFGTDSPRWDALHHSGAHPQRPLWASTGVKNPDYKDTMYVDDLVAPHTVNTMPLATLQAVADHGTVSGPTATHNPDEALKALQGAGIDLGEVTDELLDAGVKQFEDAMSRLLDGIEERRKSYKEQG